VFIAAMSTIDIDFLFKKLAFFLREREHARTCDGRGAEGGGREGENLKQAPSPVQSPLKGSIS